jgi:uncharacterized phiE125 gp8 family phage protein
VSDNYRPILVTAPTADAVTLEQAKKQCEIAESDTAHDEHLYQLIDRARDEFETDCDLCIKSQTWRVYTDDMEDAMQLQKGPIQSITSIKYYSTEGTLTTLASDVYNLDVANRTIHLAYNKFWPATLPQWDAWEITYLCGYSTVPPMAVQAMLILIEKYFLGREVLKEPEFRTYQRLVSKMQRSTYP